jgi:hypothetical protein
MNIYIYIYEVVLVLCHLPSEGCDIVVLATAVACLTVIGSRVKPQLQPMPSRPEGKAPIKDRP